MIALAAMDGGVYNALGGVLRSETPKPKIIMNDDCFSRHGWRCYNALGGVLRSETPKPKIIMDDDFGRGHIEKNP